MRKVMAMTVPVPARRPQIAPRARRQTSRQSNQRRLETVVDDVAKAFRESDARQPHH